VLSCTAIGTAQKVESDISAFIAKTEADELMITSQIYNHEARLKSYKITAKILNS